MQICQIVGYKNAGKTTVMKQLIDYFSKGNRKIGSIKHHGHGGDPALVKETDSSEHCAAGAQFSGVQGEKRTQLIFPNVGLDALINMYAQFSIDILLIEGFKQASFPKIVLIKHHEDLSLLNELSNIIAVGSWDNAMLKNVRYPTFNINHITLSLAQLAKYITDGRCQDG